MVAWSRAPRPRAGQPLLVSEGFYALISVLTRLFILFLL